MLVSKTFVDSMLVRIDRKKPKARSNPNRSMELITIPGYGTKTKTAHAKTCGLTWNGWDTRYRKWCDDNITVEELMSPKVAASTSGKRGSKTWARCYNPSGKE